MPRPHKGRRICALPDCTDFGPRNACCTQAVTMTLDEYETIRLIDLEDLTQELCAQQMGVARTTIQAIYAKARKKLARCIVEGCMLRISGGEVEVRHPCGRPGCKCCVRKKDARTDT